MIEICRRNVIKMGAGGACTLLASACTPIKSRRTLEGIRQSGVIRVGVTTSDPWYYEDPFTEKWSGVCTEIAKMMAGALQVRFAPVETSFANAVAAIQAGQIDIMPILDPTPHRHMAIDFPDAPLFYYAIGALLPDGKTLTNWGEVDHPGIRIGVTLGSSVDAELTRRFKRASIVRFVSNDEAIAAFISRRVDIVSQFHPALIVQAARIKLGHVVLPEPVTPIPTSVGLAKSPDPSLREWIGRFIAQLYQSRTTERIFESYIAAKGVDPHSVPGITKELWR